MEFILQALKGKNHWWRTLLITVLFLGTMGSSYFLAKDLSAEDIQRMMSPTGIKNVDLILQLLQFGFLLGLFFALFYVLHRRSIISLTTARPKIDFKRFFFVTFLVIILQTLFFVITYWIDSSHIAWNFNPIKFFILLVICVLLLPIQIGFEEYFFRGYLMQQIGVKTKSVWFSIIISSVFFGLAHSANPEVAEIGFKLMVFYIGTGLFLAVITLLDDGLELPLGFHFANNLMSAILVTSDFAVLQTDAMFRYTGEADTESMFNEAVISMLITYPIFLYILSKKYNWNWSKLLRP